MYIMKCEKDGCKEWATNNMTIINKDTEERITLYLCGHHASKINDAIKEIIYDQEEG